jgi:hypothetical protein
MNARFYPSAFRIFSLTSTFLIFSLTAAAAASVVTAASDDLMFIHHSSGGHWLLYSLRDALRAKPYVAEFTDIGYTSDVAPDDGRPDSLTFDGLVPGDHTDVCHWVRWFNDYLGHIKIHGCTSGVNRIVMFKSCYPNSNVGPAGATDDPFSVEQTLSNYKAVFRHPAGPGHVYTYNGFTYKPLEDIFAANPDTLFIYVTAPPLLSESTDAEHAANARIFNNWVKTMWLAGYNAAHPGLNNVVVFDWFDVLAIPAGQPDANMLRPEYASGPGDNHPNEAACNLSTQIFATNPGNFLDTARNAFISTPSQPSNPPPPPLPPTPPSDRQDASSSFTVFPNPYCPGSGGRYADTSLGKGIVFNGLSRQTRIRIYTISGDLVKDIDVTDGDGRYLWDATNSSGASVASGIYLYVINFSGEAGVTKGKLAIMR